MPIPSPRKVKHHVLRPKGGCHRERLMEYGLTIQGDGVPGGGGKGNNSLSTSLKKIGNRHALNLEKK